MPTEGQVLCENGNSWWCYLPQNSIPTPKHKDLPHPQEPGTHQSSLSTKETTVTLPTSLCLRLQCVTSVTVLVTFLPAPRPSAHLCPFPWRGPVSACKSRIPGNPSARGKEQGAARSGSAETAAPELRSNSWTAPEMPPRGPPHPPNSSAVTRTAESSFRSHRACPRSPGSLVPVPESLVSLQSRRQVNPVTQGTMHYPTENTGFPSRSRGLGTGAQGEDQEHRESFRGRATLLFLASLGGGTL